MKETSRSPQDFLPLSVPVFHILLALTDVSRHGYGIILEVEGRTGGSVRIGTGTLYSALKRLLRWGLVEESDSRPDPDLDDERRRYYRLTPLGAEVVRAEAARLELLVGMARHKRILPSDSPSGPEHM